MGRRSRPGAGTGGRRSGVGGLDSTADVLKPTAPGDVLVSVQHPDDDEDTTYPVPASTVP